MPRRPAPVKPRPSHKLTSKEVGEYGHAIKLHILGDGSWAYETIEALTAEANRLLGIQRGKPDKELRSFNPKREARMCSTLMDRRFDSHGRRAS